MSIAKRCCPDCGRAEGQLHEAFCLQEHCPFCGGQLAACDCIFTVLNLSPEERVAVEEYVDDMEEPLRSIGERWHDALKREGRIPVGAGT